MENPAAKPGSATNPIQRNIEVSGVRFDVDPKNKSKIIVKFVVTNHSGMDLSGLAGNVTLWGSTRKSEEDAQGSFSFATNLRPFESKDLEAPLTTKFKIYEMPDWQAVNSRRADHRAGSAVRFCRALSRVGSNCRARWKSWRAASVCPRAARAAPRLL